MCVLRRDDGAACAEDVTEELEYIPAKLFVKEHVRPRYACKTCQDGVVQADLPPRPIEKGRPGPGLLAQALVSECVDHLPLYRQSRILDRFGIDLARSTLCDRVAVCVLAATEKCPPPWWEGGQRLPRADRTV